MMRAYNISGKYSIHTGPLRCEICGKNLKSLRALEVHLRKAHFGHDIPKFEEYYNNYLKSPDEGVCIVCGKPTRQRKFKYDKCCSETCSARFAVSQRKYRNDDLIRHTRYDRIFAKQIKNHLHIPITEDDILSEFARFCEKPATLKSPPNDNKCVLYFQQDNFYKEEKRLFSENPEVRYALIENREKYLFKPAEEISDYELLRGFKVSGLHHTYSHFSPYWSKYIACKFGVKDVADPFGGWGHHMLGFKAAGCKYHYNDICDETVGNVVKMDRFFGFECDIRCGDARDYIIPESCDAVFMCPPYYNMEIYGCGPFSSIEEYESLMSDVVSNWRKSNADYLFIIIREDLADAEWFDKSLLIYEEPVNIMKSHFNKSGKTIEMLYVLSKSGAMSGSISLF